jgi:hypothetical protein
MAPNTYGIKNYGVPVDIGLTVIYTAGPNDVTTHGLQLDQKYVGLIVDYDGFINDPDHGNIYYKYKIRLFLGNGNDLTISRSELHYHTAKMLNFTELIPTDDGTFRLVNEEILSRQ